MRGSRSLIAAFILFCLMGLHPWVMAGRASTYSGRVDFGYISDSSGTGTTNSTFSTELKAEKDKLSAEFSGKVHYQKTEEEDFADILSTIQTNYSLDAWLFFLSAEYRQDKINGIEGRVDTGAGVGYQIIPDFRIQSGLYKRFGGDDEFLSKTTADYSRTIWGPLSFQEKTGYEVKMNKGSDNRFTAYTSLKTKLGSQVFLKAGLDYSRDNDPEEGYPKDVRKWETTVGVEF